MTDYLNTTQAAAIAGVQADHIGWMIRRRGLPATRVGRQWAIRRADLEAFMESYPAQREAVQAAGRSTWNNTPAITPKPAPVVEKPAPAPVPRPTSPRPMDICAGCGRRCVVIGRVCFDCLTDGRR